MSFRVSCRWVAIALLAASGCITVHVPSALAQGEITRKIKNKVTPVYPELARRMNISGVVKIQVTVAPNGTVKTTKLIGGHPLLANAAMEAIKKWRYETASEETSGIVEFRFDPNQ